MNSLVLIVEDNIHIKDFQVKLLEKEGISFIHASDLNDAEELFWRMAGMITEIALDGNLSKRSSIEMPKYPETSSLAKIIANCDDFKGLVFPMSATPAHNDILKGIIGSRCEIVVSSPTMIKIQVINEIVGRIKKKRGKYKVRM